MGVWDGNQPKHTILSCYCGLIIVGYHRGIDSLDIDPCLQTVIDILNYASSRSSFDQKMGYGFVDAYIAYGRAFTMGGLDRQ